MADIGELDSTWNQMTRHVKNNGLREGAVEGQDHGTSQGFDEGYAEGFRAGCLMGEKYGMIQINQFLSKNQEMIEPEKVEDQCEICLRQPEKTAKASMPQSIEQLTYDQLKQLQGSRTDKLKTQNLTNLLQAS